MVSIVLYCFCILWLYVVISGCTITVSDTKRDFTSQELAQRLSKSTVVIRVARKDEDGRFRASIGTGFVVKSGYIATNFHVIDRMQPKLSRVSVPNSKKEYLIQRVVATDKDYDLAIIRCMQLRLIPVTLGNSNKLQVGEKVFIMGNPHRYYGTFSEGIISAIRDDDFKGKDEKIQVTAPVSPGSSGSPIVNVNGEVIGVITSQATKGQNLNFASPINPIRYMLQEHLP
jgi:S1-C subfamily serine protease